MTPHPDTPETGEAIPGFAPNLSQAFIVALKCEGLRNYTIAQKCGMHPSTLSKLLRGGIQVRVGDPRIIRIGEAIGLAAEDCFRRECGSVVSVSPYSSCRLPKGHAGDCGNAVVGW